MGSAVEDLGLARLQLTRLSLQRPADNGSFVGDRCGRPECRDERGRPGVLGVYAIKHEGGNTIRYLSCNVCGWKPEDNKLVTRDEGYSRDVPGQRMLFEEDVS